MSLDTVTAVLGAVVQERVRQDAEWGQQDHPDLDPTLPVSDHGFAVAKACRHYTLPWPEDAKYLADLAAKRGRASWVGIAVEELVEAMEAAAHGDTAAVRTEVVQLAAVCVQWVQAIDRRREL